MQHWKATPKVLSPLPLKWFMKSIHFHHPQGHWLHLGHNHHSPSHECPVSRHTLHLLCCCCSVSRSVMTDALWPLGLQHARLPCPSPCPRICSNSCPLSQWCHTSVVPFSSCFPCFPASESFPVSQLFASGGQSIGASVLPVTIQGWFPGLPWWLSW